MSNSKEITMTNRLQARTPAAIKASAPMLLGQRSRVAGAEAGDDGAPVENGAVGELWLYGVVGGYYYGFNAESVAAALRGLDVDVLYVRIHSPGGYAPDGIAIANLLRNHKAKIVVVVDGLAASAASVIAIAGDEVVMCPGSQMMLHDASTGMWGNAAELRRAADWIDGQSNNYAGVYQHRAGGTVAQWREVMLANDGWGTYFTADEAVAAKLADSVGTRIAAGSPPTAPKYAFDEEDEELLAQVAHDLALLEQNVHPAALAAWQGERPKPPTASAGGSTQPEGAAVVDFNDKQIAALREQVGFPADADADTIVAAVSEALNESADPQVSTQVPEGMRLVSATVFDDVSAKAESGARAAEELLTMKCNAVLDRYKDRFPATEEARAKWAADYRRDPAGTEKYLSQAAVLVPTEPIGHGGDGENQAVAVTDDPNYQKWSF